MLSTIVICGGIYGAVLGLWHGPKLSFYVAAKIPILLICTAVMTSLFNFVVAALMGLPLRYRQVFAMTLLPLAIAALIAASVAPAVWLFTISLPPPSPLQRTLHNLLYLLHVGVVGSAGYAGTAFLRQSLEEIAPTPALARNVRLTWIALYAFVGGEIAWILRPFVGSVYLPVAFIRDDALRGNVYEFIVTDILPHLLGS
ncbi:MAG TPA: hypothetical protein VLV78_23760 [Thermoanaerobaculia bacterium]|nr:hypothetical protein [Thermoanaerobaculia bacterium]